MSSSWEVPCWCVASFNPGTGRGTGLGCQQSLVGPVPSLGPHWGAPTSPHRGRVSHPRLPSAAEARVELNSQLDAPAETGLGTWCPGGQAGGSGGAPTPERRSPSNLSQLHYSWPAEWPETQPLSSSSLCRAQAGQPGRNTFQKSQAWGRGGGVHHLGPGQVSRQR